MQHNPFQTTFGDLLDQGSLRHVSRSPRLERTPDPLERTRSVPQLNGTQTPPNTASLRLSRDQVIDRIVTINTSATAAFLDRFGTASLHQYLDHLDIATGPRGRDSGWQRPGDSPSIVSYQSDH